MPGEERNHLWHNTNKAPLRAVTAICQVTQLPSDVMRSNWNLGEGCNHGADRIPASHRTKIPLWGEDQRWEHGALTLD